jgi:predicted acylesterase/phospholipase RssA
MSRCALSVSTAGVYGAWEAGAIEALLREAPAVQNEPRRRWDALYGASAGAINVAVLSAYEDQMEGARALTDFWIRGASVWREPTVGACVACARQCLGKVSMLDDTALRSVLSFVDWQQVGRHAETWVAVTNAETQHSELLPLRNPDEGLTSAARAKIARDNMDVVVASSSVPALWPAVRVGSGGPYVDSLLTLPVPYPGGAGPGSGGPPVDRLEIVVAPSSPLASCSSPPASDSSPPSASCSST